MNELANALTDEFMDENALRSVPHIAALEAYNHTY
jgi:hypothetical protein